MSRVPWPLFQERQHRAHLVVGAVVEITKSEHGDELAAVHYVLKRLVSNQKPSGDYAASVARDGDRPEVYFAFDNEADAHAQRSRRLRRLTNIRDGRASARSKSTVPSSGS